MLTQEQASLTYSQKSIIAATIIRSSPSDWVRTDDYINPNSPRFELNDPRRGESIAITFNLSSILAPHFTVELTRPGSTKVWQFDRSDTGGGAALNLQNRLTRSMAADSSTIAEIMRDPAGVVELPDVHLEVHLSNKSFNLVVADAKIQTADGKEANLHMQVSKQITFRWGEALANFVIEARLETQHGKYSSVAYPDTTKGAAIFKQLLAKADTKHE